MVSFTKKYDGFAVQNRKRGGVHTPRNGLYFSFKTNAVLISSLLSTKILNGAIAPGTQPTFVSFFSASEVIQTARKL